MSPDEEREAKAHMTCRAVRCWDLMDENERAALRFGLSPLWTCQEDLGGKAPGEAWEEIRGDWHRLAALALYEEAARRGKPLVV
jgi:hypothetical protein